MIYGLPLQKPADWGMDLNRILKMGFENQHISLYQLTIEKGTKFFSMFKDKKFDMPNEDLQSEFYDLTKMIMCDFGFESYEISNYAKSREFQSIHNLGYWNYQDYLGIGPGAHSRMTFFDSQRSQKNFVAAFFGIYKPENWLKAVFETKNQIQSDFFDIKNENKPNFLQNFEILDSRQILEEIILMGLRTKEGISFENFAKKFNFGEFLSFIDQKTIEYLKQNQFLEMNQENIFLTQKGQKVSDFIIKKICANLLI